MSILHSSMAFHGIVFWHRFGVFHSFPVCCYMWDLNLPGIEPMPCEVMAVWLAFAISSRLNRLLS
jgi:hypothetical protein